MTTDKSLPDTDDAAKAVEVGREVEILDETPVSMFVQYFDHEKGKPVRRNVAKNDRNELLFKHNMYGLIHSDESTIYTVTQEPYAAVSATGDSTYTVWVGDEHPVQTDPSLEERLLRAVREVQEADEGTEWTLDIESEDARVHPLRELHQHIIDTQVRRNVVNRLLEHPPFSMYRESGILEVEEGGWLFHGMLRLTWEGELRHRRGSEEIERIEGSSTRRVGTENDAFDLEGSGPGIEPDDELERHTVKFGDREVTFGMLEMEFVTKAIWVAQNVTPRGA